MKTEYKKFDKTLFEENDPLSREAVKRFYLKLGYNLIDNPNQYGVDLFYPKGQEYVEVERRIVWDKPEFPFNEINLPQRKAKFFCSSLKSHYAIVSKDYNKIGIINSHLIKTFIEENNLKESPNKFISQNEYFYKLPKSKFIWASIPA